IPSRAVPRRRVLHRLRRRFLLLLGAGTLSATVVAATKLDANFGDDVRLAPFVVNGKALSIAIHARTAADRKYGEQFATDVVQIAYETMGKSTGAGLVIVGREGEPHPILVLRKFQAMAADGRIDPAVAAKVGDLGAMMAEWKSMLHFDDPQPGEKAFKMTLDMVLPALPLPLEGATSKLYQLSWAEDFNDARVEQRFRSLTVADLESNALSKYDWVFYLPPRHAFKRVEADIIREAIKHEKMGLFRRAALHSAAFVLKPAINGAVEAMRKGVLYLTVLRADSGYGKDDIFALTTAYTNVLMPNFKIDAGSEHDRARAAIEKQKIANAEYAKDPFVTPARLAAFDPAAYAAFEGEYSADKEKRTTPHRFKRQGEAYTWQYKDLKPRVFYPAGGRRFVNDDGTMTIEFQVDAEGGVTGVEERWLRRRQTIPRKS
ncbi:MAG TPA: hypothetical protein VG710_07585, partial [Opitutus sp.]|nr:hypothetical protein [Opitutus sp.]